MAKQKYQKTIIRVKKNQTEKLTLELTVVQEMLQSVY